MSRFEVQFLGQTPQSRKNIEAFLEFLETRLDMSEFLEISVTFCERAEMASLNGEYRGSKGATDILTFPLEGPVPGQSLGDIYLCEEEFSDEWDLASKEELTCFLLAHGLLHLLGYTHETKEKYDHMIGLQLGYIQEFEPSQWDG